MSMTWHSANFASECLMVLDQPEMFRSLPLVLTYYLDLTRALET